MDEILFEVESHMETALDYLRKEFRGIRTGRASGGLVEHIKVDYYGSPTDLRSLATISTPEPALLIVKPYDLATIKDIEKAILASNLGLTPSVDGPTIRLAVAILKDQSDAHQPDPVMLLHGGPGEKTVARSLGLGQLLAPLHPNRDFIVFDQRGVGSSEPALECPEIMDTYLANMEETDPNIPLQLDFDAWITCRDRLLEKGHNLSAYNTT